MYQSMINEFSETIIKLEEKISNIDNMINVRIQGYNLLLDETSCDDTKIIVERILSELEYIKKHLA
jgi:hypothetical protein